MKRPVLSVMILVLSAAGAWGLDRTEILVVYNGNSAGSKELADYYVAKRQIPRENVLGIQADRRERIDRQVFLDTIQKPIRAWMDADPKHAKVRCVLLMRGVPLAVNGLRDPRTRQAADDAARAVKAIEHEKVRLEAEKKQLEAESQKDRVIAAANEKRIRALETKITETDGMLKTVKEKHDAARKAWEDLTKDTNASVDSELALMFWDGAVLDFEALKVGQLRLVRSGNETVKTKGVVRNLLEHRTWDLPGRKELPRTIMVCRLDAASDALVKRMIDDSIAVENAGLQGVAYFDARGIHIPPQGDISYYAVYDELIRRAAAMVEKTGMKTVLDDKGGLFAPDSCPDAALYCGWYSLEKYVPAFRWVKGSVGFHVASGEAITLRGDTTRVWCKRMIDEGVAATFGPVNEPYLQSFLNPSPFFAFLLTGRYTMAEAFWYSNPVNSWMMTLIADPLYTPFRRNPKMSIAELKEALTGKPLRQAAPEAEPEKPADDGEKPGEKQ